MKSMKKIILLFLLAVAAQLPAKDLHTLTVKTTMHCENCTKRIKKSVRFEKGVKNIKTDLETKTVTVLYDADKGKPQAIVKAIEALGYETTVLSDKKAETPKRPATDGDTGASTQAH